MATHPDSFSSRPEHGDYHTSANINSLPSELLVLIFSLVMFSSKPGNDTQFHLAWICRYWRQIVFDNLVLWTTVSFRSRCFRDPEYMELVLRKSSSRERLILFGPGVGDTEVESASWIAFHKFLSTQFSRIETLILDNTPPYDDSEPEPVDVLPGLRNFAFKNLQVLSIAYGDEVPIDFHMATPNLQALQIVTYSGSLPRRLPSHLKKLSLCVVFDGGVLDLLLHTKELEYLSIFFVDSVRMYHPPNQVELPNLTTLKANGSLDMLSAPALTHIELAASKHCRTYPRGVCRLVDGVDLSKFTHLYVGYTLYYRMHKSYRNLDRSENPVEGCIWASVGPAEIPCLTDQPTMFRKYDVIDAGLTKLPSSWFTSGSPDDTPLIHVHVPGAYNFTQNSIVLPCKLIAQMVSLETLVLCLPDTPYPPHYGPKDNLELYRFHLSDLFNEIAHHNSVLHHLVIRSGDFKMNNFEMLLECFNEKIWTASKKSCPFLESVTFHAPSPSPHFFYRSSRLEFWNMWINFIRLRQECGHPLKLLRIIGAYPPSSETLKRLEEFSEFTKVIVEDADDTAYHDVELNLARLLSIPSKLKCYTRRGF